MFRKNQNVMIILCIALGIAVLIIAYLVLSRSSPQPMPPPRRREIEPMPPPQARAPPPHAQAPPHGPPHAPPHGPPAMETPVGSKPAIVLFYADWCGHSKAMMPEWEKFKQGAPPGMFDIIQFEEKANPEHIKANGVRGFPTIRFYPAGFPSADYKEHRGDRSMEGLVNFVKSSVGGQ